VTKRSRREFLERLSEATLVEERGSGLAVSCRRLARNPYRPYLHLRIAEFQDRLEIRGWVTPSSFGVMGIILLGAFAWWYDILPSAGAAAAAVLLAHVILSAAGFAPESFTLEGYAAAAAADALEP
jgi:hypothetical protein